MRWKSQCLGKGNGLWSWGMGRVGEAGGVRLDQSCLTSIQDAGRTLPCM